MPGIDDVAQDVRQQVRCCFIVYTSIPEFKDAALKLVHELRSVGKKQLVTELQEHGFIEQRMFSPSPDTGLGKRSPIYSYEAPKIERSFLKNAAKIVSDGNQMNTSSTYQLPSQNDNSFSLSKQNTSQYQSQMLNVSDSMDSTSNHQLPKKPRDVKSPNYGS